MKTTVKVGELIPILEGNKAEHRAVVEEAWDGYLLQVTERAKEMIEGAIGRQRKHYTLDLSIPSDHTNDYDRAIGMLRMTNDEVIELTEQEYAQYIEDDWQWKRSWAITNAFYSASVKAPEGDDW